MVSPKPKPYTGRPPSPIIIVPTNVPTSPVAAPALKTPPASPSAQEPATGEVLVVSPTNTTPPPPPPLSPPSNGTGPVDVTKLPSMQPNGVPPWKQAILLKKQQAEKEKDDEEKKKERAQQAARSKKQAEEEAILSQVPHWKREIVKRKLEQQRKDEAAAKEKQEAVRRQLEEEEKQFKEKLKQEGVDDNKLSPWQLEMIKKKKQLVFAT
ncbi:PREDICTED: espin-like [Branchiostoma belcheri]|uniref:Espin-like n=1 Tax=Branchiostoma belcheri TaxID=7741 RepID=A0A6P5A1D6_BRABE|nr:PREDICTED: espin-like [Branchiostoma belcheri]